MRITILDLDWYNKQSFLPNIKCMKLSSYHQQLGDLVLLAQNNFDLTYQFDIMYVVRESMMGSVPKDINLRDTRMKLIGKAFKFYDNYVEDITPVQAACRPDYTLYPIKEENKMSKANMAQFYSGGKRLTKIQNFDNAYRKTHYTYVVDKDFWSKKTEDIEACVSLIQKSKNIAFKEPISLENLLNRPNVKKLFMSLHYDTKFSLPIINDCDVSRNDEVLQFLVEFKQKHPTAKRLPVYFDTVQEPENGDKNKALQDLISCFQLMEKAKKYQVDIYFKGPPREWSPFWFYFEELESWTKYHMHMSWVEHLCQTACYLHKMSVDDILVNKLKWSTTQTEMLGDMIKFHPDIIERYGLLRWGDTYYNNPILNKELRGKK